MKIECPDCGTELNGDGHGHYDCPSCLVSFDDASLGLDNSSDRMWCERCNDFVYPLSSTDDMGGLSYICSDCLSVLSSRPKNSIIHKCPKCDAEVHMVIHESESGGGALYQCTECNMGFFPEELGLGEEEDEEAPDAHKIFYGECLHCGKAVTFEWDDITSSHYCSSCGKVGDLEDLAVQFWEEVASGGDWLCCPFCAEPVEFLEGALPGTFDNLEFTDLSCGKCGSTFELRKALKALCPHCSNNESGFRSPNVLHMGDGLVAQQFLCLDCNQSFEVDMKQCPKCGLLCPIDSRSAYGLLHYCSNCEESFRDNVSTKRTSSVSRNYTSTHRRSYDWDDEYNFWSKPVKSLEKLVEERFVLEVDL